MALSPAKVFEIFVGGGMGNRIIEGGFESRIAGVEIEPTFFAVGVEGGVGTVG